MEDYVCAVLKGVTAGAEVMSASRGRFKGR